MKRVKAHFQGANTQEGADEGSAMDAALLQTGLGVAAPLLRVYAGARQRVTWGRDGDGACADGSWPHGARPGGVGESGERTGRVVMYA